MSFKRIQHVIFLMLPLALSSKLEAASLPTHHEDALLSFSAEADAPHHTMSLATAGVKVQSYAEMERVFSRSDEMHRQSMEIIAKSLSFPSAMEVIQHSTLANTGSALTKITNLLSGSQNLRSRNQDDGFGGLDGARRLLNSMIHEAMTKYDAEIAKCTDYYAKQCALMEIARGQISAANFIAANSRALILDAQSVINQMELDIPATKLELKASNLKCKTELHSMNEHLKVLLDDVAVMTLILEMSDCDTIKMGKMLQTSKLSMLKCKDSCTNTEFVTFNHTLLQSQVNKLQSKAARDLMASSVADIFDEADSTDSQDFEQEVQSPPQNKTPFITQQPPRYAGRYTDKGAPLKPRGQNKRCTKCTLKNSPRCYKIAQKFLQIQAGIIDSRDKLMEEVQATEDSCAETKQTLEDSIATDVSSLSSSQTKLAAATEKESTAGEKGRQVAKENEGYNSDLLNQMKICSQNYVDFETELCALRKIRGDVFKKMQAGHKGFFQDCEVTAWSPEACSKKCAGGDQKLTRSVLTHPGGETKKMVGAKCLPLSAEKRCNRSPCSVDCRLATWSGWSKCSSKCGGGLATRVRDVKVPMQYDGKPCSATSEAKQCNVAACEKHCVLHEWTKWTSCSKDCDGGSNKRQRMIKEPAEGSGTCADQWSPERLQYKNCAMHRCKLPVATEVLKCNKSLDIVLVMDGTPKTGKVGWAAEVAAANLFIDGFTGDGITAQPNFAVIHYTGPPTWSGVSKCTGASTEKVDMEKVCKIKIASHFEEDTKKVKGVINALEFAPGSKLLSLALMAVQAEMALGRKTSRSIVIVFMDGEPLSYRKTMLASHTLRKKARLIYVVVTKFSPLGDIKKWASRRWQENVVQVSDAAALAKSDTGTHIMANICPKSFPKLKTKRGRGGLM